MLSLESVTNTVGDERMDGQGTYGPVAVAQAWSDAERRAVQAAQSQVSVTMVPAAVIQGSVGRGGDNRAADVRAIHQRLIAIGVLPSNVVTPAAGANDRIPDAALHQTIGAVELFQRHTVSWWMNYPAGLTRRYQQHAQRLGLPSPRPSSTSLTTGRIVPGDATYEHLNRISVYNVRFPGVPAAEDIRLRDYVRSIYTLYPHGFDYSQASNSPYRVTQAPLEWFTTEGGLTPTEARALIFVADSHEGGYLTFNSYDLAVLTFGFIQFTASGSLQNFLAQLKRREAATFDRLFRSYGVDVEVSAHRHPSLVAIEPGTGRELRDDGAARLIGTNPLLAAVFIRSGRDRVVQHIQVQAAIARYAMAPLRQHVEYTAPNGTKTKATFRTLLTSPAALATLFDRTIQRGNPGQVRAAVIEVAHARGLTDIAQIARAEHQSAIVDAVEASLARESAPEARRIHDIKVHFGGSTAGRTSAPRSQGLEEPALYSAEERYSQTLAVVPGEHPLSNTPALASHQPSGGTDLYLRWNTIPNGVTMVDIVLHLHGWAPRHLVDLADKLKASGLDLIGKSGAPSRGRPTLAILPRGNNYVSINRQGQRHPNAYNFPALHTLDGLRRLIDYALDQFGRQVGISQPRRGRFILTAHSGGGSSAMRILEATRGTDLEPQEVHIFDALYGSNVRPLTDWVQAHIDRDKDRSPSAMPQDGGALRVFFGAHTETAAASLAVLDSLNQNLRGKPAWLRDWYRVEVTTIGHSAIPKTYGGLLLSDAHANLPQIRRATAADAPRTTSSTPAHAHGLQADECVIQGPTVTCGDCVAHERRVRGAEPAHPAPVDRALCYGNASKTLESNALQAYRQLLAAARSDGIGGDFLKLCSGYRSYDEQAPLWRSKLLAKLRDAGCSAAELACAGPAIDRTTQALRNQPIPHPREAWPDRFAAELRQAHCTLSCKVAAVIADARSAVAVPGSSPHHTGRALDLFVGVAPGANSPTSTQRAAVLWQRRQPAYRWLVCNAHRFNFFPYNVEPWHWEYNPPVAAGQGEGIAWSSSLQSALPARDQVQPTAFPPAAAACAEIVRIANAEAARWLRDGHQIQETDPRILAVLADYWRTGVGVNYSEAELADSAIQARPSHAWSAAFISWVMRKAGLGTIFRRAAAHAVYIRWAIENRLNSSNNPFGAYRINEVTPRLGDLLCKNRLGGRLTYDTIRPGHMSHCDIVTEVHSDRIVTIGGNVSISARDGGSVMRRSVPLDASGHVVGDQFIAIIRYEDRAPV